MTVQPGGHDLSVQVLAIFDIVGTPHGLSKPPPDQEPGRL